MRYGCCVNMVTKTRNLSGIDIIPVIQQLGFDYAELSLSHLCAMSHSEFAKVKYFLKSSSLPSEVCNNFFPATIHLTGPQVNRDLIVEYLKGAFEKCHVLGVQTIVFGSGPARQVPAGFPFSKALEQLADLLRLISDYAHECGIIVAIEPLRKQECNIVNTYCEALELERLANASQIKCLLDYYHLSEENESISVIQTRKKSLGHVHFSEPDGRLFPSRVNREKYFEFFSNLKLAGYNHRFSLEAYSDNFIDDAEQALKLLKEIEYDLKFFGT